MKAVSSQVGSEFEKEDRHVFYSSWSTGNIDAHTSIRTEPTETHFIHLEMETDAQRSILV